MSVNQALSAALAGVDVTQKGLAVIAGNVANANTPGYIDETLNQTELVSSGTPGVSVNADGINRNLNTLVQDQLWTETSGGSYADKTASFYQQLQQIYGTPGSATSFDGIFNSFTTALQALSTSPSSYSAQSRCRQFSAGASTKSQLDDHRDPAASHSGRTGDRHRRSNSKHGLAANRRHQQAA